MEIQPAIFRAYDIRGEIGKQISPETFRRIAQAYGSRLSRDLGRPAHVLVARDLRTSSAELSAGVVEGLRASGCRVSDIGEAPTPVLYFAIDRWGADGGMGVTASHKPAEFNGLKIRRGSGPFYGESLQALYREIVEGNFVRGEGSYEEGDIWPEYFASATSQLQAGAARGVRVVLDLGNGCGTFNARGLLEHLGCQLDVIFEAPDGTFPNRPPDPLTLSGISKCAARVRSTSADLGLAIDADGDRMAVVDERGEMIWPDRYVTPLCRAALEQGPATFVTEVRCTRALIEDVEMRGGQVEMRACGYPFILQGIAEKNAVLGFETTGHCYFNNPLIKYDDAAFGAARLLESLAATGQTLRTIVDSLPVYHTAPEERVDCPDETKFAVVDRIRESYRGKRPMLEVDGARIEFPEGWALIRASNTGAELVLRWEGRTEEARDRIGNELQEQTWAAMKSCGGS